MPITSDWLSKCSPTMQHSAAVKVTNKGREGKQRGLQIEDFGPGCAATGDWSSQSGNRSQKLELVPESLTGHWSKIYITVESCLISPAILGFLSIVNLC